jgi:hypothetical protein
MVDRTNEDSNRVLIYKDKVVGRPAMALFYMDQRKGLLKGIYSLAYGSGPDCQKLFLDLSRLVEHVYPSLRPLELRTGDDDDPAAFCAAAVRGKASWSRTWTAEPSGNSIRVILEPDGKVVDLVFQSSAFRLKPVK